MKARAAVTTSSNGTSLQRPPIGIPLSAGVQTHSSPTSAIGNSPGRRALVPLFAAVVTWGAVVFAGISVWADLEAQPADKHSTLIDKDGGAIRDDVFAGWVKDLLIKDSGTNALDAKFFFQQCYGGGMLDDIQSSLGTTVKWVGGSASKHSEPSTGQVSTAENAVEGYNEKWVGDPPQDFWTKALIPELAEDQTLLDAINNAGNKDLVGPNTSLTGHLGHFDNPQSASANNGSTIKLKDPAAESYHAILWAGSADHMRHYNDVKNMFDTLKAQWGDPATNDNISVSVLFGDGMKNSKGDDLPAEWNAGAATKDALMNAISGLADDMNDKEQFLFFASNHGGTQTDIKAESTPPTPVEPGNTDIEYLDLFEGELAGMFGQYDNVPTLSIDYSPLDVTASVTVSINDYLLGSLDPFQTTTLFEVPESWLSLNNVIEIDNSLNLSSFDIYSKVFSTGGIDMNPIRIPESATVVLLAVACVCLAGRRRYRAT